MKGKELILKTLNKRLRFFKKTFFFVQKHGVKYLGLPPFSRGSDQDAVIRKYIIKAGKLSELGVDIKTLRVNPDFLNDKYTLTGIPILNSPYIELMHMFERRDDVRNSEYYIRALSGRLDLRRGVYLSVNYMQSMFEKCKKEIFLGKTLPITIFKSPDERWWVFDGKHKIAVMGILGITDCFARIVSPLILERFTPMFEMIAGQNHEYFIHKNIIKLFLPDCRQFKRNWRIV
ncbi:hypothetical protein KKC91_02870 [bacterium]|nr:hypothetical protein [bacterium]